eukprot:2934651-Rhodomonas_salina.1
MVTLKAEGRPYGTERMRFECVGALEECKALAHLDLSWNQIGAEGAGSSNIPRGAWRRGAES